MIALALATTGLAHALPQSLASGMRETPLSKYTKTDIDLLTKAAYQTLDSGKDGVAVEWSNPGTPNGGTLTPSADPKGRAGCRVLLVDNHHASLRATGSYLLCKGKTKARPWDIVAPIY
ncbi:MAG: hypothetical protein ABWZ88_15320 [Variovorax sp.]